MRFANSALLFLIPILGCGWCSVTPVFAQEFRIDTDVFRGEEKEPVNATLTIFSNGVVYDFLLTGVEEVTMFDKGRNRLVLMDTQRKVKTELTTDSIVNFVAEMRARMTEDQRKFLLSNSADSIEDNDGWLKLANERVEYRAECVKPKEKSTALEYQEFADWYARLNAMRPGNLPPFMRIRLNSEIAKRGLIPKTIERTISDKKVLKETKSVIRSRHLANWRLSNTDRKWIDRAGTYLATFRTVPFREYIQLPAVATNGPSRRR